MTGMELAISILRSGMGYHDAARATGLPWRDIQKEWSARVLHSGDKFEAIDPFAEIEIKDPRKELPMKPPSPKQSKPSPARGPGGHPAPKPPKKMPDANGSGDMIKGVSR